MLTVTTAATDTKLLTATELRAAIGQSGMSDGDANTLSARVSLAIARACKVVAGRTAAGAPSIPTLLKETLSEKIWLTHGPQQLLIIARAPIVKVTAISENGTALTPEVYNPAVAANPPTIPVDVPASVTPSPDYEVDGFMLRRLSSGRPTCWATDPVVLAYEAGLATVPDDLKQAAGIVARAFYGDSQREAGLRSVDIPDVIAKTYQDKAADADAIPADAMQLLSDGGYINYTVD